MTRGPIRYQQSNQPNFGADQHHYTYDAEGNIVSVDSGSTAQYTYDAFNQRVRAIQGSANTVYIFNAAGQRVASGNALTGVFTDGVYYWGAKPIAYYTTAPAAIHFQHQDWLGTERARTTYSGATDGVFSSLPFGDAFAVPIGTDTDAYHFAGLDLDPESNTNHAQFRNYSQTQGRWLSPDPYDGSYDFTNPQSFNRYAYVGNNPLSFTDPSGEAFGLGELGAGSLCAPECAAVIGIAEGIIDLGKILGWFKPQFHGTLQPRPGGTGTPSWGNDPGSFGESGGLPINGPKLGGVGIIGLPDAGCEFGACGFRQGPGAYNNSWSQSQKLQWLALGNSFGKRHRSQR